MASLLKKIQGQQENLNAERRAIFQWLMALVNLWEEMLRTEYCKLHLLLYEEENQYMVCMKNQSNTISEELRECEAMMVHKRSQLIEMYHELMAMSLKPYEDLDGLFRRSELVQLTQGMKPNLSVHPNTGLTARFNYFQDSRPYSENPFLDLPGSYHASLGAESFTTGKHYWELDLRNHEQWAVGVCNYDWLKMRNYEIGSEGAFLLECLKEGDHYSLLTTCPTFNHYIEKPTGQVGMFLDCEGGCVSFLDVTQSSLIYGYCPGTFHCTVRRFFSTVYI